MTLAFEPSSCEHGVTECRCWGIVLEAGSPNRHVYPFNDVALHDCDVRCVCGPTWQAAWDKELQSAVWLWVHHSYDGREQPRTVA